MEDMLKSYDNVLILRVRMPISDVRIYICLYMCVYTRTDPALCYGWWTGISSEPHHLNKQDLNPRNFVTKIVKYDKVVDVPNSMTVLTDLLPVSMIMAQRKLTGAWVTLFFKRGNKVYVRVCWNDVACLSTSSD
jgi:hypothetical protein